jgi:hypothetical protein
MGINFKLKLACLLLKCQAEKVVVPPYQTACPDALEFVRRKHESQQQQMKWVQSKVGAYRCNIANMAAMNASLTAEK